MTGRLSATLAALALTAGLGLAGGPPASAAYCGITWGSTAKVATSTNNPAPITNVRAGRHVCFDRMVVDVRGRAAGYNVRYVPQYTGIASGLPIPLRGGARLSVTVVAPAYNSAGQPTYRPANPRELVNVAGYCTFRQVALGGSFEGRTSFGLGVRARLPMRVFVLPGPGAGSRVVIDVAHRW
ncbi:AMIN-like domain-containing (lipo)protein [Arthrobacter sp. Ld5]|uniref:AMIN-like domain-containing (lipo)protein n=1 Tax=Arthrobacter sp. Ld5 TaxID=649152 RepID=UPI003EBC4C4E